MGTMKGGCYEIHPIDFGRPVCEEGITTGAICAVVGEMARYNSIPDRLCPHQADLEVAEHHIRVNELVRKVELGHTLNNKDITELEEIKDRVRSDYYEVMFD
ncbi:MAG: hypothetical protein ACP5E4_01930 [Candidatus Aenigmatarchaeota archaeon]